MTSGWKVGSSGCGKVEKRKKPPVMGIDQWQNNEQPKTKKRQLLSELRKDNQYNKSKVPLKIVFLKIKEQRS